MDPLRIADIDAKVLDLRVEIAILLRQRNALALMISTLPTEVLCTIFVFVKFACRNVNIEGEHQLLKWVKVTHVCHLWREVGIQACYLWNEIPLHRVKWATEMIARSKGVPLIATEIRKSKKYDAICLEPLQSARIHELNMRCLLRRALPQMLWKVFSEPEMPLSLHTIRVDLSRLEEFYLFSGALGKNLPSLRRIMLQGCGIDWNAPFLRNVTHLRLSNVTDSMKCYRIDLFLEALKTMPMLEMLYFATRNWPQKSRLSTTRKIPVFALPNLKFLAVVADIDPLGIILTTVSLPSISATCLCTYEHPSSISTLPLVFSSLLAHPQPQIRTLEIRNPGNRDELRIRSWPVALSQMDVSTLRVIPAMETTWKRSLKIPEQDLFRQFCFENLISLSLPQAQPMDAPTWARIFGTLSALEFINIHGKNARCLFEALIYNDRELTTSSIPFPSLLSISIEDMNKTDKALQDLIIGVLIERYELGREVREIIFVQFPCHWLNDLVCRIREVVVDVEALDNEFWRECSRPTSRFMYHTRQEPQFDEMADRMGFWS